MTAGTEVVGNDVGRKVEIEDKCVAGLDMSDLNGVGAGATVDGNVGGIDNVNVGGDGKDDSDESSYVFVGDGFEVIAGDPAVTGVVNVDAIAPKSDSSDEVDQFQKEELGIENGGIHVDPLVLEVNGVDHAATVIDPDVKAVNEVNLENGSTVDTSVVLETNDIAPDVNGHLVKITGEEEPDVESTDEVPDANGITNEESKVDDIVPEGTFTPESTLNPIDSSQVTVFEPESIIKVPEESESQVTITPSEYTPDLINTTDESLSTPNPVISTDSEAMVNGGLESPSTLIDHTEGQITVDESSKPSEELESQVTADVSESSESPIQEQEVQVTVDKSVKPSEDLECAVTADVSESSESPIQEQESQVTVDDSGKPSEDLECKVTADEPETLESPIKEQESQGPVNGSELIDNSVENQECPASVDRSESSDNHIEEVHSTIPVIESDIKSEEEDQELLVMTSAVSVEAEPNHVFGDIESKNKEAEAEAIIVGSGIELKENPDVELVLSEDVDALANGQVEKFEAADEVVPLVLNVEKEDLEEKLETQVEESIETPVEVTESVELEHVKAEDEIQESQTVVLDNVQDDLNLEDKIAESTNEAEDEIQESQIVVLDNVQDDLSVEDNTAESTNDTEAPLETATNSDPITHEDTTSQDEVSKRLDETQESSQPEESAENVKILASNPDDVAVVESDVEPVAHPVTENVSAKDVENVDAPGDEEKEAEVKDAAVEDHSTLSFPDTCVNPVAVIEFGSIGRHEPVPTVQDDAIPVPDVANEETKTKSASVADDDNLEQNTDGDKNSDKLSTPEVEDNAIRSDQGSVSDAPDVQIEEEAEVLPYNFLIRIPRFEDETFREQIKSAQMVVEEKTRLRDAIRVDIHAKRLQLKSYNEEYHAAKLQDTDARRLVRIKRQEIDTVQAIINRMKNVISVNDIDNRIFSVEHMIQHETLQLKDEKQLIREIKQLKTHREQLASNIGDPEEVNLALEQKDQIEDSLKILRKELDVLKGQVTRAEAAVMAVKRKCDDEIKKERELQAQFRAADTVRQKAYAHLNSLKKQAYDKNKTFRMYKEDVMTAKDFAARGDKDGLHRLCANQVETFMEQWNTNDEFRKEYVNRINLNAIRRQKALENSSAVPDDVAPATEQINNTLVSIPTEVETVSVPPPVKQRIPVSSAETKPAVEKEVKNKGIVKPILVSEIVEAVTEKEEENKVSKEEMELARKAEELEKEEMALKLKEQRRLEEKAKAAEALERKKRNAEKAQQKAELRARKEAEQKEKEKEKRLRKKEKKKAGGDSNGEEVASESANEATAKEIEAVKDENTLAKKKTAKPPPHFFSKQLKPKPIPPPLVNRNRKRWQQYGKVVLVAVAVLVLFMIGNTGFFLNLKVSKENGGV